MDQDALNRLFYTEHLVELDELLNSVTNKSLTAEELNDHIKRVIYNGYPTNKSGIKENTILQMRNSIHYPDGCSSLHRQQSLAMLTLEERWNISLPTMILSIVLSSPRGYDPQSIFMENSSYQSLVSTEFKDDLGVELELF